LGLKSPIFGPPGDPPPRLPARIRRRVRLAQARTPAPKPSLTFAARIVKQIAVFRHCFAAVATMAQALQLAFAEQLDVAAMRNNMVNIGCLYTQTTSATITAERLAGQLSVSAVLPAISWIRVQVMPGSGFLPD